jgi:hypothetical protein
MRPMIYITFNKSRSNKYPTVEAIVRKDLSRWKALNYICHKTRSEVMYVGFEN